MQMIGVIKGPNYYGIQERSVHLHWKCFIIRNYAWRMIIKMLILYTWVSLAVGRVFLCSYFFVKSPDPEKKAQFIIVILLILNVFLD